jgi:hypothetical protein
MGSELVAITDSGEVLNVRTWWSDTCGWCARAYTGADMYSPGAERAYTKGHLSEHAATDEILNSIN